MNLTEAQTHAMLEIGGSEEAHSFIPQRVLNDLLSYELIQWSDDMEVELTPAGKEVYDELAGSARKSVAAPTEMSREPAASTASALRQSPETPRGSAG